MFQECFWEILSPQPSPNRITQPSYQRKMVENQCIANKVQLQINTNQPSCYVPFY